MTLLFTGDLIPENDDSTSTVIDPNMLYKQQSASLHQTLAGNQSKLRAHTQANSMNGLCVIIIFVPHYSTAVGLLDLKPSLADYNLL